MDYERNEQSNKDVRWGESETARVHHGASLPTTVPVLIYSNLLPVVCQYTQSLIGVTALLLVYHTPYRQMCAQLCRSLIGTRIPPHWNL